MKTKAFCPNCGSENEGFPGGRVTCRACTASFEVPRDPKAFAPEQPLPPPPSVVKPPPVFGGPPAPSQSPNVPPGYVGPPPAGFGGMSSAGVGGAKNQLAVVSLVLGILCCLPFSIGAVITGFMALKQIDESRGAQSGRELAIAGIVLGGLSIVLGMVSMIFSVLSKVH